MIAKLLSASPVLAQPINLIPTNAGEIPNFTIERLITGGISLIMIVVGLAFFFMLVMGGLKWVVSEGDKSNVEAARNQVTNALIGLAIVFSAWAILNLIGRLTGFNILGGIEIKPF